MLSNASGDIPEADAPASQQHSQRANGEQIPAYKIAMLGAAGVGKTTLTYQFTTSDYICAYDLSLGKCGARVWGRIS